MQSSCGRSSKRTKTIGTTRQRPTMRIVALKSLEQQDLLALHRIRARLVEQRTGLCNQIRGLLAEYGIVLPQAISRLRRV
jgi:transposase